MILGVAKEKRNFQPLSWCVRGSALKKTADHKPNEATDLKKKSANLL
jgi:hypothetical protein